MNQKTTRFLLVALTMLLCFLCTACGDSKISESVKRPESSTISPQNDPNEGLGGDMHNEDIVDEVGLYEGLWLSEVTDQYDYLEIDADGNWQLFSDGYVLDEGYLWYDPEWDTTFVYSTLDGFMDGGCIELEGDQIYIDVCGYFDYLDGRGGQWQGDIGSNWDDEYREDEVYHQDISVFEGTWYYDNDLSAETFIIIDAYGNWSFYQRTPGDPEATEMDYGTFSYSADEVSVYYADSAVYDGVSYWVFELGDNTFFWGEETYDRLEW